MPNTYIYIFSNKENISCKSSMSSLQFYANSHLSITFFLKTINISYMRAALKVMCPNLLHWPTMSGADVGDKEVEVELSIQWIMCMFL